MNPKADYFVFAGTFCIASAIESNMGCWVSMHAPFLQTTGLFPDGYESGVVIAWVMSQVRAPYNVNRGVDISDPTLLTVRENKDKEVEE